MKKIVITICICLLVGLFGFIGVWTYINFEDLKLALSGTQIYTKDDVDNAYQDGYDKALDNKTDYDSLLSEYREDIASLTDEVSRLKYNLSQNEDTISKNQQDLIALNNQLELTIAELNEAKASKEADTEKIAELELEVEYLSTSIESKQKEIALLTKQNSDYLKSIDYYKNFITTLETETSAVATFMYDGKVVHMEVLTKGSCATFNQPEDTEYLKFNYWMVNNEQVDLASYPVNTNTTFVANIEKSYDVTYYVENELYDSKIVLDGNNLPTITEPTKTGYNFVGWSLDKVTILDSNYIVTNNIELYALFEAKTWNISYVANDDVVNTEKVKTDNSPIGYSIEDTDRQKFLGWSIDGSNIINIPEQIISADTTYIAVFEYYYSVNYVVDGRTEKSVLIKSGEFVTAYTPNSNQNYEFIGWTLDGATIVDITTIQVTADTNIIAKIRLINFDITFTNSTAECLQIKDVTQSDNIGFYAYKYYTDLSNYDFDGQPFKIGLTLTIHDSTPIVININELYYSTTWDIHRYHYNYYPNSSDSSTHYDISFEVYENYIRFSCNYYNNLALNDKPFTVTLNMSVVE